MTELNNSLELQIANYQLDGVSPDDLDKSQIDYAINNSLIPIEWRIKNERY